MVTPKPISKKLKLFLIREKQSGESTLSGLYLLDPNTGLNNFLCWCLEDKVRKVKIKKKTAIFTGVFPVKLRTEGRIHENYKTKFSFHKGMLHIDNLVDFKFVMFHIGNDVEDTEGCPLMGDDWIFINTPINGTFIPEYKVVNSTKAYEKVYKIILNYLLTGWKVEVEIKNNPNIIVY